MTNKLMRWRRDEAYNENLSNLVLELSLDGRTWYHYTNPLFSSYRKPEKVVEGIRASVGFSTMQHCLTCGFKFVDQEGKLIN